MPNIHARLIIRASSVDGFRIWENRMLQADDVVAQITKICVHERWLIKPLVNTNAEARSGVITALNRPATRLFWNSVAAINQTTVIVVVRGIGIAD